MISTVISFQVKDVEKTQPCLRAVDFSEQRLQYVVKLQQHGSVSRTLAEVSCASVTLILRRVSWCLLSSTQTSTRMLSLFGIFTLELSWGIQFTTHIHTQETGDVSVHRHSWNLKVLWKANARLYGV